MSRHRRERRRRRGPGGLLGRLSLFLSILGAGVVVVFVVSRVVTDRFGWSQWLWWVPAIWWTLGIYTLLAASLLTRWIAKEKTTSTRSTLLRAILTIGCLALTLYLPLGVWKIQNALAGHDIHQARAPDDPNIRVLHWNIAASQIDTPAAAQWLIDTNADVLLLANTRWDGQRQTLTQTLEKDTRVLTLGSAMIASRLPIRQISMTYIGSETVVPRATRPTGQTGWVCRMLLDDQTDQGLTIWLVDLPSEPTAWRMKTTQQVIETLSTNTSNIRLFAKDGSMTFTQDNNSMNNPALIIGDFNTPRSSASLQLFNTFDSNNHFTDAFTTHGTLGGSWKPTNTKGLLGWFAKNSSWHIDLALVGNGYKTNAYQLATPTGAHWGTTVPHRAQIVDVFR